MMSLTDGFECRLTWPDGMQHVSLAPHS